MPTPKPPEILEIEYLKRCLPSRRNLVIGVVGLIALILCYQVISHGWKLRKFNTYLEAAKEAHQTGNVRQEYLALKAALKLNSQHIPALMQMATLAERVEVPEALDFSARVVYLEPENAEHLRRLFHSSLQWRRMDVGIAGFNRAEESHRSDPYFYSQRGVLQMSQGDLSTAMQDFERAVELDPENQSFRLNQIELNLMAYTLNQTGAAIIEEVLKLDNDEGVPSLLLKLRVALMTEDQALVIKMAKLLLVHPKANVEQKLNGLAALYQADPERYAREASKLQQQELSLKEKYQVAKIFNRLGDEQRTLDWSQAWPQGVAFRYPLQLVMVDAYITRGDKEGLSVWLEQGEWNELEAVHALVRSGVGINNTESDHFERWLQQSDYRDEILFQLARMAQHWKFDKQYAWILEKIVDRKIFPISALKYLYTHHRTRRDAAGMLSTMLQARRFDTADPIIKNNLAYMALLLDKSKLGAQKLAKENYQNHPKNPAYVSTVSLSLFRQGRVAEALILLNSFRSEGQLNDEKYDVIELLSAVYLLHEGKRSQAELIIQALESERFLPEEWELLQMALRQSAE